MSVLLIVFLSKMSSFRAIRELSLLCFEEGILSEEEFVLLYQNYHSGNPEFPYDSYSPFCLKEMNEAECLANFRVKKHDLFFLQQTIQIPATIKCPQRTTCPGIEGLCILLNRLSYPCRYSDMIQRFGRPVPELSLIANKVVDIIFDNHGHRLLAWNLDILSPENLQIYAHAIHEKGAPLENCFGFIDGTVRPISRPGQHQRVVYNGHKIVHSLKFQCIALPNGMIANMFGPVGK